MILEWKYLLQLLSKNLLYRIVVAILFAIFLLIMWMRGIDLDSHIFLFKFPSNLENWTFYKLLFYNLMPIIVYFGASLWMNDVFPVMISQENLWVRIRNQGSVTSLLIYYSGIVAYSLLIVGLANSLLMVSFYHFLSVSESVIGFLFILFLQQMLAVGYLINMPFIGYIFLICVLICLATTPTFTPFQIGLAIVGNIILLGINPLLLKNKEYL
ncbi:hypothetical protein [Enterococcus columbae]|uniref:Uncharacterized protein n=1 Tax=Enterococcus columbae DSM 7374 = ATCC 51263 TaxID=1121865 RepID=S0KLS7_9ENTE|nr:hypothetical protein [Enterococcus columbae]EOT41950.1 hypothetical protein OMW_01064 [Enterococcus columbae DSM 7374 = ATCC 51263]EOW80507.1 hypothetical protein I568_01684 [Enterococcus columbae DSM 7374 = ATCC 51263]